jgi:chloramphenicol-sensitive protein RarD
VRAVSARALRSSRAASGAAFASAAFGAWGLLPIYWKALSDVPLLELLAHRIWLSAAFALVLLAATRRIGVAREVLAQPRARNALVASASLIALNWGLFIFSVARGDVLASSLGYFLNPLVNVALGVVFLRERLRPLQAAAVSIAAAGMGVLAVASGGLPWISLALAVSFGFYGLLRKAAPVTPVVSLAVETTLLAPLALGYVAWLGLSGEAGLGRVSGGTIALLAASGVLTGLPLLAFAAAAARLRLATLGLFQYLAPSLHFLLAVGLYGEPFAGPQLVAFGSVWVGLALYSADSIRAARAAGRAARAAPAGPAPGASGVHPSIEIS